MRALILGVALCSGCYRPSLESCRFKCANNNNDSTSCPSGLSCEAASSMCVAIGDSCLLTGDAKSIDAAIPDAPPNPGCTLKAPNVTPCDLFADSVTGTWHVSAATIIDTGDQQANRSPAITLGSSLEGNAAIYHIAEVNSGVEAAIVVVDDLVISAKLSVIGKRPLIILSHTAMITATITAANNAPCAGQGDGKDGAPAVGASGAGGGGGGGNGMFAAGAGGAGFSAAGTTVGAMAGAASGHTMNEPLLGGCTGGLGGAAMSSVLKAAGGAGGGAIQITAFTSLVMHGSIEVGGQGGKTGSTGVAGGGGGGGGGAGGSILLDSPTIDMAGGALCGNGGGGGGLLAGQNGSDATCNTTVAPGGDGTSGNGAANTTAATAGANATVSTVNGAGGGGATGIIHFTHLFSGSAALITPPNQ